MNSAKTHPCILIRMQLPIVGRLHPHISMVWQVYPHCTPDSSWQNPMKKHLFPGWTSTSSSIFLMAKQLNRKKTLMKHLEKQSAQGFQWDFVASKSEDPLFRNPEIPRQSWWRRCQSTRMWWRSWATKVVRRRWLEMLGFRWLFPNVSWGFFSGLAV